MAIIEDTGGNITITIDDCACGATGGYWKCQPIHYPPFQNAMPRFIERRSIPFTYQEWGVKYIHGANP